MHNRAIDGLYGTNEKKYIHSISHKVHSASLMYVYIEDVLFLTNGSKCAFTPPYFEGVLL
jgi:hypothetical protein